MRKTESMTLFFSERDSFSNWFKSEFEVKGVKFNCVEQFMMYCKARMFDDIQTADKILLSDSPKEQKRLGREVKGYDDKLWSERRVSIVTAGCIAKFTQNPFLREDLIGTGNTLLVEASPYDRVWGGRAWGV